jgi:ankyrin repeat protein
MTTVSRDLPSRPHLDVPKRQARDLLKQFRAGNPDALDRVRRRHPRHKDADASSAKTAEFRLSDAQLVIAREYGLSNWTELKERINANTVADLLNKAIRADDRETVSRLLQSNPQLLHIPVWSGNWGPPMSHAANLGRLEIIKLAAQLGARDYQHAFDRAVLQGKLESARWLLEHGAKLTPGMVMGPCETLNSAGFRFLMELGAPCSDDRGNRLAPLAMVLETYCRNPAGKHEILDAFENRGFTFPDTAIMALHRGNPARLKEQLQRDPGLINRRFTLREIYPPELGCADDERSGLHGTPIAGTTLLHLAIEFDEPEIFDLLLTQGADVNARALVNADGFGGHTPLFNSVVNMPFACGRQRDAGMTRALLHRGASPGVRTTLRKFLDWCETPRFHEAREVTPAEWGHGFPEKGWVSAEALRLLGTSSGPRTR